MRHPIDKSAKILAAATRRFRKEGYGRTSLAQIAEDCGISMAHIYNFHENKLALVCAVVEHGVEEIIATIEMGIAQEAPSSERLTQALRLEFETTFRMLQRNPGFASCLDAVESKRPAVHERMMKRLRSPVTAILRQGRDTGLLPQREPKRTAEMIQTAMTAFRFPQRQGRTDHAALREDCEGVIDLIVHGAVRRH